MKLIAGKNSSVRCCSVEDGDNFFYPLMPNILQQQTKYKYFYEFPVLVDTPKYNQRNLKFVSLLSLLLLILLRLHVLYDRQWIYLLVNL